MAVHPLRPATHRRLGRPLPYQPANGPRAHPLAGASIERPPFILPRCQGWISSGISTGFPVLSQSKGQIAHVLLTRPLLTFHTFPRRFRYVGPFNLHVLGTPPAFVLSQDQTLRQMYVHAPSCVHVILHECSDSLSLLTLRC